MFLFWPLPQQPWHSSGPLFSAAPDPCHSPGAVSFLHSTAPPSHPDPEPFLSSPRTRRDTPLSAKLPVSRKKKRCFHVLPCRDTPFSAKYPVSRKEKHVFRYIHAATHLFQGNTLYRGRKPPLQQTTTAPKHTIQSSDTPFTAK